MSKAFFAAKLCMALVAIIVGTSNVLYACDACSGSISTFSPSQTFLQKSHTISLNTDIRLYDVTLVEGLLPGIGNDPHSGHSHAGLGTDVYYQEKHFSYNLSGMYYPTTRLALMAIAPYNHKVRLQNGTEIDNISGFGDVSLMAQYHVVNAMKDKNDTAKVSHRLTAGGGIKLPTGRFNIESYEGEVEPYLQPGSGSVDFHFTAQYLMMVKGFGVLPVVNAKLNTANRNGFRFAHTLITQLTIFYSKSAKRFNIRPAAGVNLDHGGKARTNGDIYGKDTGGNLLSTFYGLDLSYKNFGVNFTYFQPVYQQLDGSQFENKHRLTASLRYVFQKKKPDVNTSITDI